MEWREVRSRYIARMRVAGFAAVVALSCVCACGRLGFDNEAPRDSGPDVDAPSDALSSATRHWVDRGLSTPGGLIGARAVFHRARGTIILYGGDRGTGFPPTATSAAMWEYDGTAWTKLCDPCAPGGRFAPAMAYDAKRDVIALYGGSNESVPLGDLWEWNGAWTQIATSGTDPGERAMAHLAYDERRNAMVLFGGCRGPDSLDPTVFEYAAGTWTEPLSVGGPTALGGAGMGATWDSSTGAIAVLEDHGTRGDVDTIWSWDGATWTTLCTACTGDARRDASLVFDPQPPRLYELGGFSGAKSAEVSGTWVRDAEGMRLATPLLDRRDSVAVAYDAKRDVFVLYGGNGNGCSGGKNCAETWELVRD